MTTLITCHGNGATRNSFAFLKMHLPNVFDEVVDLEYDSNDGFPYNLSQMSQHVERASVFGDVFFLTHSLGSIYAAYLADKFAMFVAGGCTISAPWGGSQSAYFMQMLDPKASVYKDIVPTSPIILGVDKLTLNGNWTSIVSTKGKSNLVSGLNDGILTLESMRANKRVDYADVPASHHEVMLNLRTVEIVNSTINDALSLETT